MSLAFSSRSLDYKDRVKLEETTIRMYELKELKEQNNKNWCPPKIWAKKTVTSLSSNRKTTIRNGLVMNAKQ